MCTWSRQPCPCLARESFARPTPHPHSSSRNRRSCNLRTRTRSRGSNRTVSTWHTLRRSRLRLGCGRCRRGSPSDGMSFVGAPEKQRPSNLRKGSNFQTMPILISELRISSVFQISAKQGPVLRFVVEANFKPLMPKWNQSSIISDSPSI